ncbi:MAG: hypothetical protein Q4D07_06225 [Selenomonadaceae bacterium]|nr:hypothetical protein [Selenomonadaceae bacterium]
MKKKSSSKILRSTEESKKLFLAQEQAVYEALLAGDTDKARALADSLPSIEGLLASRARIRCIAAMESGLWDDAKSYADECCRLQPDGNSHFLQARIRYANRERTELLPLLEKALTEPITLENRVRCYNLMALIYRGRGDAPAAVENFHHSFEAAKDLNHDIEVIEYDNYLFNSHYLPYEPMELAQKHFRYQEIVSGENPSIYQLPLRRRNNIRAGLSSTKPPKIRIGYISPDLHEHVVLYFSRFMFTCANREKFEIYAYNHSIEDGFSEELKSCIDGWRNIAHVSDEDAAKLVAADNLDILIDLSGHTRASVLKILAYKPAPIIISGIGYFSTIGLNAIDYFLSDVYLAGADEPGIYEHPLFKEKLLVLPHTHWSYSHLHPRQASCLQAPVKRKGYVSFGSFNVLAKVNDEVLTVWKAILDRVPGSHLILKGDAFINQFDREFMENRLNSFGFDMSRLDLWGSSPNYLDVYREVDIALDTFPYGGGATTMDALYMSVPVISLIGETHHARFGYSILQNIGLGELACATVDEYIDRACLIASDIDTIEALHQNVRTMLENSILMDGKRYMAELEPFFEAIHEEYLQKESSSIPSSEQLNSLCEEMHKYIAAGDNQSALALADQISVAENADERSLLAAAECYKEVALTYYKGSVSRRREALNCLSVMHRLHPSVSFADSSPQWEPSAVITQSDQPHPSPSAPPSPEGKVTLPFGEGGPLAVGEVPKLLTWAKKESLDINQKTDEICNRVANLILNECDKQIIRPEAEKAAAAIRDMYAPVPYTYSQENIQRRFNRQSATIDPDETTAKKEDGIVRLGFISCDFCSSDLAKTVFPILTSRDKTRYRLSLFFIGKADNYTDEFRGIANDFTDIIALGLDSPRAIAEKIHDSDIDILIDLTGFSHGGKTLPVLMYKPAPVIIGGIGYTDTTGLSEVDYIISDRFSAADYDNNPFVSPLEFSLLETGMTIPVEVAIDTYDTIKIISPNDFTEKLLVLPRSHHALLEETIQLFESGVQTECLPKDNIEAQTALYYVGYFENCLELVLNRFFSDNLPTVNVSSQYKALSEVCRQLVYKGDFSAAHNLACRLSGYGELLSADDRGILGNIFARTGSNMKAILWLQPVLNTANDLLSVSAARWDFSPSTDLLPIEKAEHRLAIITNEAIFLGLPAPAAMAKYLYILSEAYSDLCYHVKTMVTSYLGLYLLGENIDDHPVDTLEKVVNPLDSLSYGKEKNIVADERQTMISDLYMKVGIKLLDLSYFRSSNLLYRRSVEILSPDRRAKIYSAWLLGYNYGGMSAENRALQHIRFNELMSDVKKVVLTPPMIRPAKLRTGYMSGDFRHHVMFWFIYQLIAGYDRENFSVICFSLNKTRDDFTKMIEDSADDFIDISGKCYDEQVKLLREHPVDVLVDFSGHTVDGGVSLFAARVAPVQISGLGYMTTTGLKDTDYFLTDEAADPPETHPEKLFSEKLLYIPSMFCYTGRSDVPVPQYAPVTKTGYILFGSFNSFRKINDDVLTLWKEILDRVENSRLLIKSQVFIDGDCVQHVCRRLEHLRFDLSRVIIECGTTTYMNRYLDVDIHLDSFPYPGGGTTADALYMGVPVIAMRGAEHSSRFADSFLTAAGVSELLADSPADYVEKAVSLATDIPRLDAYHRTLRNTMLNSKLMDTPGYVSALETAYRRLYDEWYDKNRC